MTIETKFNVDELVYFIYDNKIMKRYVSYIEYVNYSIMYKFIITEKRTMLDSDTILFLPEEKCFKSITKLCEYYTINIE